MDNLLLRVFEASRGELLAYLHRLVVRPQLAEDLAQGTYLRCHEAADRLPQSQEGVRAWLFKVATNLAIDELRRHSSWRESMLQDVREAVESDPALVGQSLAMASTPETRAIAREHLVACLACTLRNLPSQKAAALLLKEVHGFSVAETAQILEAGAGRVKNWLQDARQYMDKRYGATCALVAKNGVCHQCVELDQFFGSRQGAPLSPGHANADARLAIARQLHAHPPGRWHRLIFSVIDDLA